MTIVDESMKLIKMLRDNGWIQVSDDVIWAAIGKDISFAKVMRNHSVDVTRRLGAISSPPTTPPPPSPPNSPPPAPSKKVAKNKKVAPKTKLSTESATQVAETLRIVTEEAVKSEKERAGRVEWGSERYETAQRLDCDPAILFEGLSKKPGLGMVPDGTWKKPADPSTYQDYFQSTGRANRFLMHADRGLGRM